MTEWYKLDNAGKMFHAVSKPTNSSVFRLAAVMKETIQPDKLQLALDDVITRLPMFAVKLSKGVFWDFLVENKEKLFVQYENQYPCAPMDPIETNGFLIRVMYYKKRIAVEFFHSVTDGTGAFEFVNALVYHYLIHLGEDVNYQSKLINIQDEPSYFERDDSYQNYGTDEKPEKFKEVSSYQIRGGAIDQTVVVHGKMSAEKVHQLAKAHGTTITAFISALLIAAIYRERLKFRAYQEEIKIAIPVNLRNLFPSNTLRNFFGVVNIGMAVTEQTTLEEIISEISKQLREKIRKESLQQTINDRVKWQTRLAARFIPLPLKYHAIRYGYRSFSERTKTMTLTNLGKVQLPDSMKSHISHMELVLYPTKKSPMNGAMIAVGDELVISFARMIKEADIIRTFFRELSKIYNLEIEVYSNDSR
ncbi:phthiocerol/phthiodiolone dimycocerosyl transferase family protein [Oceanobacillus timonensis]|uniref:phthiocerol/phthiodiolone dimycocerosyl transferase family protein n=1 Tax=Oceanobacillus timonensis TaxID=1926285 RepID=UPI0009B9DD1F|nr:acyltransferase [Oceanobacillus timonensis]